MQSFIPASRKIHENSFVVQISVKIRKLYSTFDKRKMYRLKQFTLFNGNK